MSRLEEIIKAKSEFNKWINDLTKTELELIKDICKEYAYACSKASLEKGAWNADTCIDNHEGTEGAIIVDCDLITNPENIVLL
jgi:hypothetical protein